MSQKYEKLKTLLMELFQLDQPDLDFGLYRIMHAKSREVTQFLDKDLLPQVKEAFSLYKTEDKAELEKELAKVRASVEAAGMNPKDSPKAKELEAKIKSDAVDIGALESEVYDHLFSFFRPLLLRRRLPCQARLQARRLRHPLRGRGGHAALGQQGPVLHQDQRVPARLRLPPATERHQETDARALPPGRRRRG